MILPGYTRRAARKNPTLGVVPPSERQEQSSIRSAPPSAQAITDSRLSTQISTLTAGFSPEPGPFPSVDFFRIPSPGVLDPDPQATKPPAAMLKNVHLNIFQ